MPRIISTLLFFMFFVLITPVDAAQSLQISKNFVTAYSVNAMNLGYDFEATANFEKCLELNTRPKYSMYFHSRSSTELWRFRTSISLKSDISTEELTIPIDRISIWAPSFKSDSYNCIATLDNLTTSHVNLIKQANRLFLTVNIQDNPPIVWEVPQNVLKEWKDLINRDILQEKI